jgi:hypothetical protein
MSEPEKHTIFQSSTTIAERNNETEKNMKLTKPIGTLALAACLMGATAAKADLFVDYTWVQAATTVPGYTSTGAIHYDKTTGSIVTITFSEISSAGTETVNVFLPLLPTLVLPSGNYLQLRGISDDPTGALDGGDFLLGWRANGATSTPTEQQVNDNTTLTGAWVPVPEPTTVIAGALLLLPFGASTLRILRRKNVAA